MPKLIPKPVMQRLATAQRSEQSSPEILLWTILRDKRIGVKFRRQMPIGNYIVDFVCLAKRLIVEVDGPHHDDPEQRLADVRREAWLKQQSFSVLRLTSDELMGDAELATQKIIAVLQLAVVKRDI